MGRAHVTISQERALKIDFSVLVVLMCCGNILLGGEMCMCVCVCVQELCQKHCTVVNACTRAAKYHKGHIAPKDGVLFVFFFPHSHCT